MLIRCAFIIQVMLSGWPVDEEPTATVPEMTAASAEDLRRLEAVDARWTIVKSPGLGVLNGVKQVVALGKKHVEAGHDDAHFQSMAEAKAPTRTEWWSQMVRNSTGTQLAFLSPLGAGTVTPEAPLSLPLTPEQFGDDVHAGWSIFGWQDSSDHVKCMIGQRHRKLLTGARLLELPSSAEFQFPPFLCPPPEYGGHRHPYDGLFDGELVRVGMGDVNGRSCVIVQSIGDPVRDEDMAIPEKYRGRYRAFPRLQGWLDPARAYLPIRIEASQFATLDGVEVEVHATPVLTSRIDAVVDQVEINGEQVWYPTYVLMETFRIDPNFLGPYEDDLVAICEGRVPLPDYPYVTDWKTECRAELKSLAGDRELALEFPDQTFYMEHSQAAAIFVGEGARESLAQVASSSVVGTTRLDLFFWINLAMICGILAVLYFWRKRSSR